MNVCGERVTHSDTEPFTPPAVEAVVGHYAFTLCSHTPGTRTWEEFVLAHDAPIPSTQQELEALPKAIAQLEHTLTSTHDPIPRAALQEQIELLQAQYIAGHRVVYPYTPNDTLAVVDADFDFESIYRPAQPTT